MHLKCQLRQHEGTEGAVGLGRTEPAHAAFPAHISHWVNANRKQPCNINLLTICKRYLWVVLARDLI